MSAVTSRISCVYRSVEKKAKSLVVPSARALIAADAVLDHSQYLVIRKERYKSYTSGKGQAFEQGKLTLADLSAIAAADGEPKQISGKQELLENIINRYS